MEDWRKYSETGKEKTAKKKERYLKDAVKYDLKTKYEPQDSIAGTCLQIKDGEDVIMEMKN